MKRHAEVIVPAYYSLNPSKDEIEAWRENAGATDADDEEIKQQIIESLIEELTGTSEKPKAVFIYADGNVKSRFDFVYGIS